jgi:cellulose synthase/poly-beta-1,6-N-acetylglucosamine synthase-like glycosyltransferase
MRARRKLSSFILHPLSFPPVFAEILFWLCIGAMLHTYLLYPLTLRLLPRRYVTPPVMPETDWPRAAVLIPAYNEEKVIGAKVENALALDYPTDRLEILVGSDGSTDQTDQIVLGFRDRRLRLVELPGRSGKIGVYNRLVAETAADILVFTDANVMLDPRSLRFLLRHFADPKVGVVNGGKYIVIPKGAETVRGEEIYGRYENRLRTLESEVGGMSGALGSLMAMRRELYHPYKHGSTNDDTVPSIWAALAGLRNVHDPEAKAFEESGHSLSEEFARRIRIGAGNFQTLFRYPRMLNPLRGVPAYTYFSHKVLRWIFPLLMLGAVIWNLFLLDRPLYQLTMAVQIAGYVLAVLGFVLDRIGVGVPVLNALFHFIALNVALLGGLIVYGRGIRSSAWERTAREG